MNVMEPMKKPFIEIGHRKIGPGFRPMIIAEMSGNHNGKLDAALDIVRTAAAHGADAIKLQTFTPDTLTIDSRRPEFFIDDPDSLWHGRRLWELYEEAHTPWEWHVPIFEVARKEGLACISSAFDISSVEFLVSIGVDAIKISSFELIHTPLIEAAARTGKPLLISTGMANLSELEDAVAAVRRGGCETFVLLKCTSAYPSVEKEANIFTMNDLRSRFNCEVGLSDHTLSPYTAFAATANSAVVVEKHFIVSRDQGGVDSAFSIEPSELNELAHGCNLVWQSLGTVSYASLASESASHKERPSIYVVEAMKKGDVFTQKNTRVIRPSSGLMPKHYAEVLGKKSSIDIEAETPMSWTMVEQV